MLVQWNFVYGSAPKVETPLEVLVQLRGGVDAVFDSAARRSKTTVQKLLPFLLFWDPAARLLNMLSQPLKSGMGERVVDDIGANMFLQNFLLSPPNRTRVTETHSIAKIDTE